MHNLITKPPPQRGDPIDPSQKVLHQRKAAWPLTLSTRGHVNLPKFLSVGGPASACGAPGENLAPQNGVVNWAFPTVGVIAQELQPLFAAD